MYRRITDTHREALTAILGAPLDMFPLQAETLAEETFTDYTRRKVRYQTQANDFVPAYVLLPKKSEKPRSAVVALHDGEDWSKGKTPLVDGDSAWAVDLVKRGYVVLVPDAFGFEERCADPGNGLNNQWKELTSRLLRGETLLRRLIWDISRGIDFLETLPEVDQDQIGVLGCGYSSWVAMWVAALDERITAAVGHGHWTSLRELLLMRQQLEPEFIVPRLMQIADLDRVMVQIAPRPFLMSAMKRDPRSLDPDTIYRKATELYEAFDIDNHLTFFHHDADANGSGFPSIARQQVYVWLDNWLKTWDD